MKLEFKIPWRKQPGQAAGDAAGAESAPSRKGLVSLQRIWLGAWGGVCVIVLALGVWLYHQISGQWEQAQSRIGSSLAGAYAGQLEQVVDRYLANMDFAVRDPELLGALESGDRRALQRQEAELDYLFPEALDLRVLSAGAMSVDNSLSPPLGYAGLELLRMSQQGELPPVEVHMHGSPAQHLALVRGIADAKGSIAGHLMVLLDVRALQQFLVSLPSADGFLELRQVNPGGSTLVLASKGDSAQGSGDATHIKEIGGTRWRLAYWPGPRAAAFSPSGYWVYWGSFGVALILLALVAWAVYRTLLQALREDQVTILRLVKDMCAGDLGPRYAARLADCSGAIDQLQRMARRHLATRQAEGAPAVADSAEPASAQVTAAEPVAAHIFRAYDIRGVVDRELSSETVRQIGRAIGSEAYDRGQEKVIVARDGRLSSPQMSEALIDGLSEAGREVVDIGRVPTPVLYFATHFLGTGSGVMVTGSHNPAEYNGLKMMLRGETLHEEQIQSLRQRIEQGRFIEGEGGVQAIDLLPSYIERVNTDVELAKTLKVVVDCGNGVTGELAPELLRTLGCEVVEMFCEIDGTFPNHHPDPGKPENLMALTRAVNEHSADLGVAFDGDGDRLGVVDSHGKIIWPDRLLMLLAADVLDRNPGAKIIYDVKCSRHLENVIREHGGEPLMAKTGHSFIKAKLQETGALLAGEMSGHIFYQDRWFGFDDAIYTCARLLEILAKDERPSHQVFADIPESVSTPELNVKTAEGEHFDLMRRLLASAGFGGARLITIDGLRAEFEDGWGLVRASNTTPCLVLRFEAEDAAALRRIEDEFRRQLLELDPNLDLPF